MSTLNPRGPALVRPSSTASRVVRLLSHGAVSSTPDLSVLAHAVALSDSGRLPQRAHLWLALDWLSDEGWVHVTRSENFVRAALTPRGRREAQTLRDSSARALLPGLDFRRLLDTAELEAELSAASSKHQA